MSRGENSEVTTMVANVVGRRLRPRYRRLRRVLPSDQPRSATTPNLTDREPLSAHPQVAFHGERRPAGATDRDAG
jgi:hypothetical protein